MTTQNFLLPPRESAAPSSLDYLYEAISIIETKNNLTKTNSISNQSPINQSAGQPQADFMRMEANNYLSNYFFLYELLKLKELKH
jgi:hypothetical protein